MSEENEVINEETVEEVEESAPEEEGMQISDEQLDEIADTAIAALKDILKYFWMRRSTP